MKVNEVTTSTVDIYLSPITHKGGDHKLVARNVDRKAIKDKLTKLAKKHGVDTQDFEWYKSGTKP